MPLIYLSPSLQPFNQYPSGGNEQYYMNQIADMMEPLLITNGIQFNRNQIDTNLRTAINESNMGDYDLHLAIHSNSSPASLASILKGTDVYYRPDSFQAKDAATIIADNYKNIYPNPSLVKAVPTTTLAELNLTKAPAVLIETAYHDNPSDEQWLKDNLYEIAQNLVESLTLFFDIPFITPAKMPYIGIVSTDGSNLNLRSKPSLDSEVLLKIPNGRELTVLGQWQNWYVVNYPVDYDLFDDFSTGNFTNGVTGYVSADYVSIPGAVTD